jgi:hypothetical protein
VTDHTPPPTPDSIRLQILATEHWSLLASRALAWNETWARAGMFLTTASGAIVALALVSQASHFGESFRLFGLVILPVVLFIGLGTLFRADASNYHDSRCVIGMNRIRHAYLEMAPELEPYFVMGTTDDERGLALTMGLDASMFGIAHFLSATPVLIATVNAMLVAGIGALASLEFGAGRLAALGVGAGFFVVAIALQDRYGRRRLAGIRAHHVPMFPTGASS